MLLQIARSPCGVSVRIQPVEQQLRDALLFAQQRPARGLRGVRGEHRLDAQAAEQLQHFLQRQARGLERGERVLDAAGLRAVAVLQEVVAAAADAVDLLREIHHLEPGGESADQVAGERRAAGPRTRGGQLRRGLLVAVAAADGGDPVELDQLEQLHRRPARAGSRRRARRARARHRAAPRASAGNGCRCGSR